MGDPRVQAKAYLDKNNIPTLFEILGSKLAVLKPEDPNAFIVSELSKISAMKTRGESVTLFDASDVKTMFEIFDITGRGFLNQAQYLKALCYVGIEKPSQPLPESPQLDKDMFVKFMMAEINGRAI